LLGIFDLHMPLIYGEGRRKAMNRLQKELKDSSIHEGSIQFLDGASDASSMTASIELHDRHLSRTTTEDLVQQRAVDAQYKILQSLQFERVQERRNQIHEAHNGTFQWILHPEIAQQQPVDSLITWLSSSLESKRIYWIHGKPGSGKSTIIRFLDQNLIAPDHMFPWASGKVVLTAKYFAWNPGSKLQKSAVGLLRALLLQLLTAQPTFIASVIGQMNWAIAQAPGNQRFDWTFTELQRMLYTYISSTQSSTAILLLIDGLDELDDNDEDMEELIALFIRLNELENVKMCLSSRPWNIFQDAFEGFPQLRLHDLTHNDIYTYVKAQLSSQPRFKHIMRYEPANAQNLMSGVTKRATGVFLWVRLVVRELLKGLRDGDSIRTLQTRLDKIPTDLNHYFTRLIDSVLPQHRQEACMLFQIALYEETDFTTLHPLRLIDLSFIEDAEFNPIYADSLEPWHLELMDRDILQYRLDSTIRRLNSRCMGILECHDHSLGDELIDVQGYDIPQAYNLSVDFFHRTCRDFLLTEEMQGTLHRYTKGPYDARLYILQARISQFVALVELDENHGQALALASNIMSSIARPSYKNTTASIILANMIQPRLEKFINSRKTHESAGYISSSVVGWRDEHSSFLTLAIDFELSAYVRQHLTKEVVQKKTGRPILDYVLRPRFVGMMTDMEIGNQTPNIEVLRNVLQFGADPNEYYRSTSVWASFLCCIADLFKNESPAAACVDYYTALELMIMSGADELLPRPWLSMETDYEVYPYSFDKDVLPEARFSLRWPNAKIAKKMDSATGTGPWYHVGDLLEHFRKYFGSRVDRLKGIYSSRPRASKQR
jgi:hypothetical protein